MGGDGSGRKPDLVKQLVGNKINNSHKEKIQLQNPIATEMFLPNHSGIKGSVQAIGQLDDRYVNEVYSQSNPSRALDTVYQNTNSQALLVVVSITMRGDLGLGTYLLSARIGASSPPTTTVATIGRSTILDSEGDILIPLTFIVPPNYYYDTRQVFLSGFTLVQWHETVIGA